MFLDDQFMWDALLLAERGRSRVEPNPMVGAVIVRNHEVISDGYHAAFGEPHAEVVALKRLLPGMAQGATLYVTLEPCCHHGKTPPCVDDIIAAGISRVVVAMADPFPEVSGKGIAKLREAGIEVTIGVGENKARTLNAPYLTLIQQGRPYVHLKWAMSLDGKIAARGGDSKWISSRESREVVHELRGRMEGIIVGAETVRRDDPLLTVRPPGMRRPTRIVLSSKPELPASCQLVKTAADTPVMLATSKATSTQPGIEVVAIESSNGRPTIPALLKELGRRRMTNVLVEGGAEVFGSFVDAGLVDEVHVFIAPMIIGGRDALSPVGGLGIERIAAALGLQQWTVRQIDRDVYIRGIVAKQETAE